MASSNIFVLIVVQLALLGCFMGHLTLANKVTVTLLKGSIYFDGIEKYPEPDTSIKTYIYGHDDMLIKQALQVPRTRNPLINETYQFEAS